jgi:hypothetical protein
VLVVSRGDFGEGFSGGSFVHGLVTLLMVSVCEAVIVG